MNSRSYVYIKLKLIPFLIDMLLYDTRLMRLLETMVDWLEVIDLLVRS